MNRLNSRGQGLLLIAIVLVLTILVLSILYDVFTMTPAYVYQRSVYYAFKYDPQVIVQQIAGVMQSIVLGYARNYSQFLVTSGVLLYIHALTQYPTPYSLANLIDTQVNLLINSIFLPTGLAVPVTPITNNTRVSFITGFYGALTVPGIKYLYSGGTYSSISIDVNETYNMPTLGIEGLTISSSTSLNASIIQPSASTCSGSITTETITNTLKCTFNFAMNNYTCIGPGVNSTGPANQLWAPSYYAYTQQESLQWVKGTGWLDSNNNGYDALLFTYPVDEITGNAGFNVSAVFNIMNPNTYTVGFELLTPCPGGVNIGDCGGYTVYIEDGSLYFNNIAIKSFNRVSTVNLTVVVSWSNPIQLISTSSSASLRIYVNGSLTYSSSITLPTLHAIPNTVFGNTAYMMAGSSNGQPIGSWLAVILQNAAVTTASITFTNTYTLPTNVYVAVSYNGAPALGTDLELYQVTPTLGLSVAGLNYTVCNITDTSIIFNVAMPWPPNNYPITQYLVVVNYSGITLILNPWSPAALEQIGINNQVSIPSGYSASSIVPYLAYLYNATSGSLIALTYFANAGIPTLLSIYGSNTGLYVTNIITRNNYGVMGNVLPIPSLNPLKINNTIPVGLLSIFTFNESLYNLAPGYTVIGQVIPPHQTRTAGINTQNYPGGLYNLITEYEHFPNQTLPFTYFTYTILNCQGTSSGGNTYSNYAIYLIYANGQLQYEGYTPQLPQCQSYGWW